MKPGDVVRWFRGSSGVVLEGKVDCLADEELQIFGDQDLCGSLPNCGHFRLSAHGQPMTGLGT